MSQSEAIRNPVEIFCQEWEIYQKVIDNNYMFHKELYADLTDFLASHFANRPIAVLELGCGDATWSAQSLAAIPVERYLGYDLSQAALDLARQHLAALPCPVDLVCGNLMEGITQTQETFDLVLIGFALHHFQTDEKAAFFRQCRRVLNADGALYFLDVVRDEHQNRDDYIAAYTAYMAQHWPALGKAGLASICKHVTENDFPEMASWYATTGQESGFARSVKRQHHTWHQAWSFER